MPRTIAVAPDFFAKSAVKPEKLSTVISQLPFFTDGRISRIKLQRSSTENIGFLSGLFRTAMIISSKRGRLRLIMSRWPLVGGSKDPGKMARRIFVLGL